MSCTVTSSPYKGNKYHCRRTVHCIARDRREDKLIEMELNEGELLPFGLEEFVKRRK